jgi:hypothetical protein
MQNWIRGSTDDRKTDEMFPRDGDEHVNPVEAELTMRLASTARVRHASQPRVVQLLRRVDSRAYAAALDERGLLSLLGSRLTALAPEAADEVLRSGVEAAKREARLRALMLDTTLRQVVEALEQRGIVALPLKGTSLADRVHGDPGLRPTTDVDILVARTQMDEAVHTLRAIGYPAPEDPVWANGLPEMHYTFIRGDVGSPRVELHWRVHWSERTFSEELLRSLTEAADGLPRAKPAYEFALLLLILARDGLYGPRLVVDIAAWWDRFGDQLPPGVLDGIVARNPAVRRSLVAALECLERFVGVAAHHILTDAAPDRSTRRVVAIADPLIADDRADVEASIMLIDALLSMGTEKLGFLQRYYLQPLPFVRSTYGLGEAAAPIVVGRNALHFVGTLVKKSPRMIRAAVRSPRCPVLQPTQQQATDA